MTERIRIRCRCVACGCVSVQESVDERDQDRYTKSWFCGCRPPPKGDPLPDAFGELAGEEKK